ncbi:hypothetical protein PAXRUDRAFT_92523, partial [Paxillus rubicundulus Ve08.2h10]
NLPGAYEFQSVIEAYIVGELQVGCLSGPFRSSPLQVTIKKGIDSAPDKYCICQHLSYEGSMGYSVNDEIDPRGYPTEWGMAEEYTKIIRHAPPGAQAALLDIEAVYHTIPTAPDHKCYTVILFNGHFYLDHNVPFGIASVAGLQGEVAGAVLHIWKTLHIKPTKKWVDDI